MPLTWTQLAAKLGTTARSVANWRKLNGAPGSPDLAAWEEYVEENQLGVGGRKGTLDDVKRERILKQTELDEIKIQKERKLVIPAAEVNEFLTRVATQSKARLYAAMETELPPKLEGQDVATIRQHLRDAADGICDSMQKGFTEWAESHEPEL